MSHWKQHANDCLDIIGEEWIVVHHWLDEFAKIYFPSKIHRTHHHHKEGIEEVRKKWGDRAARAAMIHILTDEGEILTQDEINKKYKVEDKKDKK